MVPRFNTYRDTYIYILVNSISYRIASLGGKLHAYVQPLLHYYYAYTMQLKSKNLGGDQARGDIPLPLPLYEP